VRVSAIERMKLSICWRAFRAAGASSSSDHLAGPWVHVGQRCIRLGSLRRSDPVYSKDCRSVARVARSPGERRLPIEDTIAVAAADSNHRKAGAGA
jgi:hypothetical protein